MSDFVKIADFTKDGETDWQGYRKAQLDSGERCRLCDDIIVFGPRGAPRLCVSCQDLAEPEEMYHEKFIRCPKCGHHWEPYSCEEPELFGDGEHEVSCSQCGHEFEVSTEVSFCFYSPAMEKSDDTKTSTTGDSGTETLHE